jgi:hypothetical protein
MCVIQTAISGGYGARYLIEHFLNAFAESVVVDVWHCRGRKMRV